MGWQLKVPIYPCGNQRLDLVFSSLFHYFSLCNNKHLENSTDKIRLNLSSLYKLKLVILYLSSVEFCPYFEVTVVPWTPFQCDLLVYAFSILSFEYLASAPTIFTKGAPFATLLNNILFLSCKEDCILTVLSCTSSSAFS